MNSSPYERILQLPLFQGLTIEDMSRILGRVKFTFATFAAGDTIACSGASDRRLTFVLNGEVCRQTLSRTDGRATGKSAARPYEFREYMSGPFVIEPYSLFGLDNRFLSTYTAVSETGVMSVSKNALLNHLCCYPIFATNYLNMLSLRSQLYNNTLWSTPAGKSDPVDIVCGFFLRRFATPEGRKQVRITVRQLATATGLSVPAATAALDSLSEQGIIRQEAGTITIEDAHRLSR